ncbi:PREDICTED: mucin-5B-like, partial [Rhagoletis zephyria]|uniref:mucin-5B-like n=1 Tax=Rhagoletis zephyria TaxID=28612 RepID=UPI00081157D3
SIFIALIEPANDNSISPAPATSGNKTTTRSQAKASDSVVAQPGKLPKRAFTAPSNDAVAVSNTVAVRKSSEMHCVSDAPGINTSYTALDVVDTNTGFSTTSSNTGFSAAVAFTRSPTTPGNNIGFTASSLPPACTSACSPTAGPANAVPTYAAAAALANNAWLNNAQAKNATNNAQANNAQWSAMDKKQSIFIALIEPANDNSISPAPATSGNKTTTRSQAKASDSVVAQPGKLPKRAFTAPSNDAVADSNTVAVRKSSEMHCVSDAPGINTGYTALDVVDTNTGFSTTPSSNTGFSAAVAFTRSPTTPGNNIGFSASSLPPACTSPCSPTAGPANAVPTYAAAAALANNARLSNAQAKNATNNAQANNAQWSAMDKKRTHKRHRRCVFGSNENSELGVVVRRKWLHLSYFLPTVRTDDIIGYVAKYAAIDKKTIVCYKLVKKDSDLETIKHINFKLGVSESDYSKILSSDIWPSN